MKKQNCDMLVNQTKLILQEYWQGNQTPLIQHLHPDILWIGSTDAEYTHGAKIMIQRMTENKMQMPPVYLDQQEYEVIDHKASSCLIVGRYRAYTKPDSGLFLSEKQRVSFYWVQEVHGDEVVFLIKHIHLSNILKMQDEEERFPTKMGKENFRKLQIMMEERNLGEIITVKDTDRITRVLGFSEIMYIESERNYIKIYIAKGGKIIQVRENISHLKERLNNEFITISRSVIVNSRFISSVSNKTMIMTDQKEYQIPGKRMKQVKEQLKRKSFVPKN